ncbi:hypothetical protein ACFQ0H_07300 [Lysobacter gummosus]|uniref:hypothetical protein n=1 Tax=Lysobacter gummosus TaxID=262324 RepID=UPI00363C0EBB
MRLAVRSYQRTREIRTDRQIEESVQRPFGLRKVDRDLAWRSAGGVGRTGCDAGGRRGQGHHGHTDASQIPQECLHLISPINRNHNSGEDRAATAVGKHAAHLSISRITAAPPATDRRSPSVSRAVTMRSLRRSSSGALPSSHTVAW